MYLGTGQNGGVYSRVFLVYIARLEFFEVLVFSLSTVLNAFGNYMALYKPVGCHSLASQHLSVEKNS